MRRIRKLIRLPVREHILLLRASALIGMVRLGLRWLPLRMTLRAAARWAVPARSSGSLSPPAARIGWAVEAAGRVQRASCLPRALAGYILLKRHGYPVRLQMGLTPQAAPGIVGHAWVEHAGNVLVGYRADLHAYTTLPGEWFSPGAPS